jgi:DNA-binding MarR family transcriptional regulator
VPRADAVPTPKTTDLADRLHSLAIHLLRRIRKGDDEFGLSAPRLSALSVIVFRGPISMGDLAAAEGVSPPTMTRLVQALEAAGLVERAADPTDGRAVSIRATRTGRALLDAGRRKRIEAVAALLEDLDQDEMKALAGTIAALEARLSR